MTSKGFIAWPLVLLITLIIIGGGVYISYTKKGSSLPPITSSSTPVSERGMDIESLPIQTSTLKITVVSPKPGERWILGTTAIISWKYSEDLKKQIAAATKPIILDVWIEGNKHGRELYGHPFNLGDRDQYGEMQGQPFAGKDLLQFGSFSWKAVEDLGYAVCPPGGLCQGQGVEESMHTYQNLVPGNYTLYVSVAGPWRPHPTVGAQKFSLSR
jgi:hypothetical protein